MFCHIATFEAFRRSSSKCFIMVEKKYHSRITKKVGTKILIIRPRVQSGDITSYPSPYHLQVCTPSKPMFHKKTTSLLFFIIAACQFAQPLDTAGLFGTTPAQQQHGESCACPSDGDGVSDCCCTVGDLREANAVVRPLLQRIVRTSFFSHFKMNLCSACELWQDSPTCMLRDCSVCECEAPPAWADQAEAAEECTASFDENVVSPVSSSSAMNKGWGGDDAAVVVDLRSNPERYTGYGGDSASRAWQEVHTNCTIRPEEPCSPQLHVEQRVWNRLLSGLHASISLHIAHDYCLKMDPDKIAECAEWGQNLDLARDRVLSSQQRVDNLHFTFALLLRAVIRAGERIAATAHSFLEVGSDESLLPAVRSLGAVLGMSCPRRTFDESELFRGPEAAALKEQLEAKVKHLRDVMRCVGCDRCKLWGTMQALGVGTALKVLFGERDLALGRQEAVALVHTLERLSVSVAVADEMREQINRASSNGGGGGGEREEL